MNIATTIRTMLVYLAQPEDTSRGGQPQNRSIVGISEKTSQKIDMLKTWLWICLAVIVALFISNFR